MLGYPYTYDDYLSEEEAMQRKVDLFDNIAAKRLLLAVLLIPTTAFAADLPAMPTNPTNIAEAPKPAPGPNSVVFAPICEICDCVSPKVKTKILLVGIGAICYSALYSRDKALMVACFSLATYAATNVID